MFNLFKKSTPQSENRELKSEILKLTGLHCSSCAVNIDLALEDLPSVKSTTNYAKSETKISFNPQKTSYKQIQKIIIDLGYQIVPE